MTNFCGFDFSAERLRLSDSPSLENRPESVALGKMVELSAIIQLGFSSVNSARL